MGLCTEVILAVVYHENYFLRHNFVPSCAKAGVDKKIKSVSREKMAASILKNNSSLTCINKLFCKFISLM